jgi:hypothetical protein
MSTLSCRGVFTVHTGPLPTDAIPSAQTPTYPLGHHHVRRETSFIHEDTILSTKIYFRPCQYHSICADASLSLWIPTHPRRRNFILRNTNLSVRMHLCPQQHHSIRTNAFLSTWTPVHIHIRKCSSRLHRLESF